MLFTGHGDAGCANVSGGRSPLKRNVRAETPGAPYEVQARLGLASALLSGPPWAEPTLRTQDGLLMAGHGTGALIMQEYVGRPKHETAERELLTDGFRGFTAPGETACGTHPQPARAAIRRTERRVVAPSSEGGMANPALPASPNRFSSYAFIPAMTAECRPEIPPFFPEPKAGMQTGGAYATSQGES